MIVTTKFKVPRIFNGVIPFKWLFENRIRTRVTGITARVFSLSTYLNLSDLSQKTLLNGRPLCAAFSIDLLV